MSSRFDNETSAVRTVLENFSSAELAELFFAVELKFDSGTLRIWTGLEDLTVAGNTYIGAGSLLTISPIEDDTELSSKGVTLSLSGMDETVLDYALTENYQNRLITMHMGFLSGGNESAGEFVVFKGRITNLTVSDDPDGYIIALQAENRLIDLNRPSNLRYTSESQKFLFSGDKGMDFVAGLQKAELNWGPSKVSASGSGASSGPRDTNVIGRNGLQE